MSDSGGGTYGEDSRDGIKPENTPPSDPDQRDGDNEEAIANGRAPAPSASVDRQMRTGKDGGRASADEADAIKKAEEPVVELTRALVWWTRVMALTAIVGGCVALSQCIEMSDQASIMRGQLNSMNETGEDTHKLTVATQDFAAAMKLQASNTGKLVDAAKSGASATEREATANIRLVTSQGKAVKAERDAANVTASAYMPNIRFGGAEFTDWPTEEPKTPTFSAKFYAWFVNYGNVAVTPAISTIHVLFAASLQDDATGAVYQSGGNEMTAVPGQGFRNFEETKFVVTKDEWLDIKSGKKKIFIFGVARYFDKARILREICFGQQMVFGESVSPPPSFRPGVKNIIVMTTQCSNPITA